MSLCRAALRIAVVQALRGRTLVGENVLDSRIGIIEVGEAGDAKTDEKKPFVAVYTSAGEADVSDLRSLLDNGRTWLTLELGVTAAMAVTDPDTDESSILPGIPATDDALELTLDLLAREIANALTDPDNSWAEIYRGLIHRVVRVEVEPLRSGDNGQRLAARQLRILVDLMPDPVSGGEIDDTLLGPFIRQLAAQHSALALTQVNLIRDVFGPSDTRGWRIMQRRRGMTADELRALGLGPLAADVPRLTPAFVGSGVSIDGNGTREVP